MTSNLALIIPNITLDSELAVNWDWNQGFSAHKCVNSSLFHYLRGELLRKDYEVLSEYINHAVGSTFIANYKLNDNQLVIAGPSISSDKAVIKFFGSCEEKEYWSGLLG